MRLKDNKQYCVLVRGGIGVSVNAVATKTITLVIKEETFLLQT